MTAIELQQQLRDIEGLDPWQWWQLSIGWWGLLLGTCLLFLLIYRYKHRPFVWQVDAKQQLKTLRRQLKQHPQTEQALLIEFSQLLRRIAMARLGRENCAGLTGMAWLQWLEDHDPKRFTWTHYQDLLLHQNYAQDAFEDNHLRLKRLLKACAYWIK